MGQNSLSNFCRDLPKEPSCEIISKSATDLAEEVVYSSFLISVYSPGGHLVQQSRTIWVISVEICKPV